MSNDTSTLNKDETEIEEPSMYKVIFINDDYTPMNIVTTILKSFFGKSEQEAHAIMLKVHKEGKGLAGVYTYDVAETKKLTATIVIKGLGYPLKIEVEKE